MVYSGSIYAPTAGSSDNELMRDVVGNKNDDHGDSSAYAHLHLLKDHTHSISKVYPTLANGVTVTGAAGAWTLGSFTEIVPASTIGSDFDIHYINVEGASSSDTFEIVLYNVETEIGRCRFTFIDIANSQSLPSAPFMCGVQPANSQIQAKVANSAGSAETITISLIYHTY